MTLDPSRSDPDVTLDLPAVSKHNWKLTEIRDVWNEPLESFVRARREAAVAALQDADHPRTMLRRTLPTERASDLVSALSDEIGIARRDDGDVTTLALTAPDCQLEAATFLDREIGPPDEVQHRGVPECCATAYAEHWAGGQTDPIAAIARNSPSTVERGGELVVEDPSPILNPLWAFQGWSFIDFYPCSFECDHARQFAIETGRILRETGNGEHAEAAFELLADPTFWSGYHGLAHVKNSWCIGEYTTDDYWHEQIVRFNGFHEDLGDVESVEFVE